VTSNLDISEDCDYYEREHENTFDSLRVNWQSASNEKDATNLQLEKHHEQRTGILPGTVINVRE
jgi:hypothetical protein